MNLVSIQGIRGSFSEEAALNLFGAETVLECKDFMETFEAVRTGRAEYAVVPVENSIGGEIAAVANILRSGEFREYERQSLKVEQVLSAPPLASLATVSHVTSHVEALKQCRRYLAANPQITQVAGGDTASCVRLVIEGGDPTWAAISSRRAADLYGAEVLTGDISDHPQNWTTFCLIGK